MNMMHCPLCKSGYVSTFDRCWLVLGTAQIRNENGILRASLTQALIRTGIGVAATENSQSITCELGLIYTMSDRRLIHRPGENCVDSFALFRCVTHSMSPFCDRACASYFVRISFFFGCDTQAISLSIMEKDCLYGETEIDSSGAS
ncbi:hypothetical protein WOB59_24600 [Methylocystis sp. IM4]|uniref:hypothetical protein n=1 Tax=Methylocystis sp. IM4 TaxID=3136560 RepID=UPI003119CAF5